MMELSTHLIVSNSTLICPIDQYLDVVLLCNYILEV